MSRRLFKPEQIIRMLREAEVDLSQGMKVRDTCRGLGISEQTYYRWRRKYGGLKVWQAERFKELEKENSRLKKAVANLEMSYSVERSSTPKRSSGADRKVAAAIQRFQARQCFKYKAPTPEAIQPRILDLSWLQINKDKTIILKMVH